MYPLMRAAPQEHCFGHVQRGGLHSSKARLVLFASSTIGLAHLSLNCVRPRCNSAKRSRGATSHASQQSSGAAASVTAADSVAADVVAVVA